MQQIIALFCAFALAVSPASFTAPQQDKADFEAFMAETNAAHAKIDAPNSDLDSYRYPFASSNDLLTPDDAALLRAYDPDKTPKPEDPFSIKDAEKEVNWLFRLLRTEYGLYSWFGGDAVFESARKEILTELESRKSLTMEEYVALLADKMSFIEDTHFMIGRHNFQPQLQLYGNDTRSFYRDNTAFYADEAMTKQIESINGFSPETLLKRAIGQDGELTYYLYKMAPSEEKQEAVVRYADGTAETLSLLPAASFESLKASDENLTYSVDSGIPFITIQTMFFGNDDASGWANLHNEDEKQQFIETAEKIRAYPAAIYDVTHNPGGNGDLPYDWFRAFTGQELKPNYSTLRIRAHDVWRDYAIGGPEGLAYEDQLFTSMGLTISGDYYVQYPEKQFVSNSGPILFLLTSPGTASAAEGFTDALHNLENAVTIGSNTGGVLTNNANYGMLLPYSSLAFQFGTCLYSWDAAYFREGVGMAPDLYLTGENLSGRLARFIARYVEF